MKKVLRPLMLIPLLLLMGSFEGCYVMRWSLQPGIIPSQRPPMCQGRICSQVVHIQVVNGFCEPVDKNGDILETIDVRVGDRVCWVNDTLCTITLRFNSELFDQSATLNPGECVAKTVLSTAERGRAYSFYILGDCCETDSGHDNPEIRVGEDDEPGGGG